MNAVIYDGKSKQIFEGDDENQIIMHYKDDAKAYGGIKKAKIKNKGMLNNKISSSIFEHLNKCGIKTHFISRLNETCQLCHKVKIIPMEVIARNIASGSLISRFNFEEGEVFSREIIEFSLKDDDLNDPYINFDIAMNLEIATKETLKFIDVTARKINKILIDFFANIDILLVDFKMEFGIGLGGEIYLADEISPDTARLWDRSSKERLDKDRFRRDLGKIEESYTEILKRLKND